VITYHEMNPGNLDYKVIGDSQEIIDGGKLDALVSLVLHVWQWTVQFGFAAWLSYCPLRLAVLFVAWVDFVMVSKVGLPWFPYGQQYFAWLGLAWLWSGLTWQGLWYLVWLGFAIVSLAWLCYHQLSLALL
jgi:hypothetical protein